MRLQGQFYGWLCMAAGAVVVVLVVTGSGEAITPALPSGVLAGASLMAADEAGGREPVQMYAPPSSVPEGQQTRPELPGETGWMQELQGGTRGAGDYSVFATPSPPSALMLPTAPGEMRMDGRQRFPEAGENASASGGSGWGWLADEVGVGTTPPGDGAQEFYDAVDFRLESSSEDRRRRRGLGAGDDDAFLWQRRPDAF